MSKKKKTLLQELIEIQEETIERAVNGNKGIYKVENRKSDGNKSRRDDKARGKKKK